MAGWVTTLFPGGSVQVAPGDDFAWKQAPCKLVLHTTEGASYPDWGYNKSSHVTVNPRARTWRQHRSLDKPAWTLKAPAGMSTNSMGAIQIEIIGYASSIKDLSGDDLDYLLRFIRFILDQTGISIECSVLFGGSETAGVGGTRRLTYAQWIAYRGILGHQHVPGNDHWDPGDIPMQAVWLPGIKGTAPAPTPPTTSTGDEDMFMLSSPGRGTGLFGPGYHNPRITQIAIDVISVMAKPPLTVNDLQYDHAVAAVMQGNVTGEFATVVWGATIPGGLAKDVLSNAEKQATIAATREITVDTSGLTVEVDYPKIAKEVNDEAHRRSES